MSESDIKPRSASFGSSHSYRPPTPPTSYKNDHASNLRRTERIHLVESTDSDTPTEKNRTVINISSSSSDSNEHHPELVSGYSRLHSVQEPALLTSSCKGIQVDDTVFADSDTGFAKSFAVIGSQRVTQWPQNVLSVPVVDCAETSDTSSLSIHLSSPVASSSEYCSSKSYHRVDNGCLVTKQSLPYRHTSSQHKNSSHKRRPTVTQSLVLVEDPHRHAVFASDGTSSAPNQCRCLWRKSDSNILQVRKKTKTGGHVEISSGRCSDSSTSSTSTVGSHRRRIKMIRNDRSVGTSRGQMLLANYMFDGCESQKYGHNIQSRYFSPHFTPPVHSDDVNSLQRLQQLESEKKNLLLQVSVLHEQVDAQTEKIKELENIIEDKKHEFLEMEKKVHQEIMTRSAVENTKLELMTEISSLRQKLSIAERERRESEERCRRIEGDLGYIFDRVGCTDAEQSSFGNRPHGNGITSERAHAPCGNGITSEKGQEIEKLKQTLNSVMISNDEKDRKIDDLRNALLKYKKLHELVLSGHQKKASDLAKETAITDVECLQDLKSPPSPRNEILKQCQGLGKYVSKPSVSSRVPYGATSSPTHGELSSSKEEEFVFPCSSSHPSSSTCPVTINKSSSLENVHQASSKILPSKSTYGTMPRQNGPQVLQHLQEQLQHFESRSKATNTDTSDSGPVLSARKPPEEPYRSSSRNKSSGVSFGKGFFKLRTGKRSSSAPELAPYESVTIPTIEREYSSASPTPQPTMQSFMIKPERDRSKGIRKFFTKWKRSGSQNIEKLEGEFRRGGIRATAGPRLGWSRDVSSDPDIPFPRWTTDYVVEWLNKIGLPMYISDCKRWRCNGEMLLNAAPQEIEKQLGIKNPLHKKKLMLALQAMKSESLPSSVNNMDYMWVVRWLDDVGLPQYKDAFSDARVDGRVLHYLTVEDLLCLKVTNQLHHVSIKRSIQVLRERNFDPHCLIRRSLPDEDKNYTPEMVALWTNHRVMEWLRTVDLSEYAPNLRGSGVHGALIVYEPKFNTDLFATLLNIPPTKTLLRRHLATHFKTIVGADLAQAKRDLETDQLYTPLTPSIKIKGIRKPQFSLKKKKGKPDSECEEFVCPMDIPVGAESIKPAGDKLVVRRNSDPVPHEKSLDVEEEKAVEEIGAVSKEITSLTNMLQEEKLLKSAPTTNV